MPVPRPEEMHAAFERAFNAADADALMALYESNAILEPQPGQQVSGHESIREALGGFLSLSGNIAMKTKKVVETGDLALLHGSWTLNGTGPDGNAIEMTGDSTEVLRRQPDGNWLQVVDLPNDV